MATDRRGLVVEILESERLQVIPVERVTSDRRPSSTYAGELASHAGVGLSAIYALGVDDRSQNEALFSSGVHNLIRYVSLRGDQYSGWPSCLVVGRHGDKQPLFLDRYRANARDLSRGQGP